MRVLLALDLGPTSESLVDRAVAWSRRLGGTVHLRSISSLMGEAEAIVGSLETSFVAEDWEARRRWERQRVNQLAERIPVELRGTASVAEGRPEQVLVELSEIAEMLILGTHARTGIARLFQGSVAEAVVEVRIGRSFPNCPRYIHDLETGQLSDASPGDDHRPPQPEWKSWPDFADVLPDAPFNPQPIVDC